MMEIAAAEMEQFRYWASDLLSNQNIYNILPASSKVQFLDAELSVEQAFHVMYQEGLAVAPISDDHEETIIAMLTASDFILILRQLHNNVPMLSNGGLEMPTISAWKEAKVQNSIIPNGSVQTYIRPLVRVSDQECLRSIALMILQYDISAIPVFKTSQQDVFLTPLLNVADLSQILKYICCNLGEVIQAMPFLHHPISRFPLGTWLDSSRGSGRPLAILPFDAPLSSALHLLMESGISSVPIVDGNGSLIDVYSRSDIFSLAKGDMYTHHQVSQMTMIQALTMVYQAYPLNNGRSRCHICFLNTPFCNVLEQLSDPGVRRTVVVDPISRQVEGIISLRDVAKFILG